MLKIPKRVHRVSKANFSDPIREFEIKSDHCQVKKRFCGKYFRVRWLFRGCV